MTDLVYPANGGFGLTPERPHRSVTRAITGMERTTQVAMARIERQAQVEATRVQAVGYVGVQAMQAATMVSGYEAQLSQMCPSAAPRVRAIADATTLGLAFIVADAAHRIGR